MGTRGGARAECSGREPGRRAGVSPQSPRHGPWTHIYRGWAGLPFLARLLEGEPGDP